MTSPSQRAIPAIVAVETSVGSGVFKPDPRLCALSVRNVADPTKCVAAIGINPQDEDRERLDWPALLEYLSPDRRVGIYLESGSTRTWLFDGYPPMTELNWGGPPERTTESVSLKCDSVVSRLSDHPDAMIIGIKMPKVRVSEGTPLTEDDITDVASIPLLFNPDGRPNRSQAYVDFDGYELPLFCDPGDQDDIHSGPGDQKYKCGDPDARYWTVAGAIRYLLWYFPDDLPFDDGNLSSLTDERWQNNPDDEFDEVTLEHTLDGRCPSINLDGLDALTALMRLCGTCGLRIMTRCTGTGTTPETELCLWSAGDGGVRDTVESESPAAITMKLEKHGTHYKQLADGVSRNELNQGQILLDSGHVINMPILLGASDMWELTAELKPGWKPDVDYWDVATGLQEDTVQEVQIPGQVDTESEWFRRYVRQGSSHTSYVDIGRKWVLNEHGWYAPADYVRSNGPFTDYAPYDFLNKCHPSDGAMFTPAMEWAQRARPMLPCLSRSAEKESFGIVVEMSFDSGTTWSRIEGAISVSREEFAILLEHDNLADICQPDTDPSDNNYAYAYIRNQLRVRVTATIESDDLLRYDYPVNLSRSCSDLPRAALIRSPKRYRRWSNAGANSSIWLTAGERRRDDYMAMVTHARRAYRSGSPRRCVLNATIPWIETSLELGRTVDAIEPRGVSLAVAPSGSGPEIVAIEWDFSAQSTRLFTEDIRLLD